MHTFTIYTQDECKTQSVVYIYTYAYIIIIFTHLIIIHTHIIMHTITTYTQDECKTQSVVYISPAHCGYVQVLPTQTEVVEFPPPYQYLPKLVFPYPTQWNPYPGTSVDTPKKKNPLKNIGSYIRVTYLMILFLCIPLKWYPCPGMPAH